MRLVSLYLYFWSTSKMPVFGSLDHSNSLNPDELDYQYYSITLWHLHFAHSLIYKHPLMDLVHFQSF